MQESLWQFCHILYATQRGAPAMNNIRNSIQMWHSHDWGFYPSQDKGPDPPIVWRLLWFTLQKACLNTSAVLTTAKPVHICISCKQALRNEVWHCKRMFLRHHSTMNYPSCCVESLFIPHTCSIVNINAPMRRWPMSDISSEGLSPLQLQQRERPEYCTAEVTSLPYWPAFTQVLLFIIPSKHSCMTKIDV